MFLQHILTKWFSVGFLKSYGNTRPFFVFVNITWFRNYIMTTATRVVWRAVGRLVCAVRTASGHNAISQDFKSSFSNVGFRTINVFLRLKWIGKNVCTLAKNRPFRFPKVALQNHLKGAVKTYKTIESFKSSASRKTVLRCVSFRIEYIFTTQLPWS